MKYSYDNMFYIPLLHIEVENKDSKKSELMNLFDKTILSKGDNDFVNTDYHYQVATGCNHNTITNSLFENELKFFCDHFLFSKYNIENSWFECSYPYEYHEVHHHGPYGYVGLFYLQYDERIHSPVTFLSPFQNFINGHQIKFSPSNVKEGSLLFFPKSILHFTHPNTSNQNRIVFSFNMLVE